jgi:hypothetical protein
MARDAQDHDRTYLALLQLMLATTTGPTSLVICVLMNMAVASSRWSIVKIVASPFSVASAEAESRACWR